MPWLEYDSRFRKEAAVDKAKSWAVIDASAWTLCFANAKPKHVFSSMLSKGGFTILMQGLFVALRQVRD